MERPRDWPPKNEDMYSETSRNAVYAVLKKLGIFLVPDFLSFAECAALRRWMDAVPKKHPPTRSLYRNAWHHSISPETNSKIRGRINAAMPRLREHFGKELELREPSAFCTYGPGGCLSAHKDSIEGVECPGFGLRTAACIIYLSTEAARADEGFHQGGSLMLYDLIPGHEEQLYGLALPAQAGLLVSFSCGLNHEVRPVVSGVRYSIMSFLSSGKV